jgi:glycosyltransferase involved in cell wall biosynthesis
VTIRNAIEPIPAHKKPEKIRLIYTSTPWRGLHLLIEAFKVLDRDVELVVYSGTSIYGKDFHEQTKDQFQRFYEELKALDVTHIEYAPNDEVRKALTQAHILAYPNTWE